MEAEAESGVAVDVPVSVKVELTNGWGGERWDVICAIDERDGMSIGDIGVYEFDAYSDFPEVICTAVLRTLDEANAFQSGILYCVDIAIMHGGGEIGTASRSFRGSPCVQD